MAELTVTIPNNDLLQSVLRSLESEDTVVLVRFVEGLLNEIAGDGNAQVHIKRIKGMCDTVLENI